MSFVDNINNGNYGSAVVDVGGIIVDGIAAALPIVPGGAGATIKAKRIAKVAKEKFINPNQIRFSQDSIKETFKNGQSVKDLANSLKSGKIKAEDIPAIRTIEKEGQLVSIDNRRLAAFKEAGIPIKTRPATSEEIRQAYKQGKFSAGKSGSDTIRIRKKKK